LKALVVVSPGGIVQVVEINQSLPPVQELIHDVRGRRVCSMRISLQFTVSQLPP
jgi:hypothetical protein